MQTWNPYRGSLTGSGGQRADDYVTFQWKENGQIGEDLLGGSPIKKVENLNTWGLWF